MPVVKTESVYIGGMPFKRQIKVNSGGVFSIGLPPFVTEVLGQDEVRDESLEKTLIAFGKAIEKFKEVQTQELKVILYSVETKARIMGPARLKLDYDRTRLSPDDRICIHSSDDIHFSHGMAISLAARVYIEKAMRFPEETRYRYVDVPREEQLPSCISEYDICPHRGSQADRRILWTAERHGFFVALADKMATLVMQLSKFADSDEVIRIADNPAIEWDGGGLGK